LDLPAEPILENSMPVMTVILVPLAELREQLSSALVVRQLAKTAHCLGETLAKQLPV
jgi:hypothetical protein